MIDAIQQFFYAYPWGIYIAFFILPFVQEDAAVIGSAAASLAGLGDTALLFICVLLGLAASDLWKYWAGKFALKYDWAKRFADKPSVVKARDGVVNNLAKTSYFVRFVPGTRIPFYVAAGLFNAPFDRFAFYVVTSGMVYIGLVFALFHLFGELIGEKAIHTLPLCAIAILLVVLGVQFVRSKMRAKAPDSTN
jgi:membrane protein DedA with SNARE-associated domain